MTREKMLNIMHELNRLNDELHAGQLDGVERKILLDIIEKWNEQYAAYQAQKEYKLVWSYKYARYTDVVKAGD